MLKYKAPSFKAFPSLSTVGSDAFDPKKLSSNKSNVASAAAAELAEAVAELAEFVA